MLELLYFLFALLLMLATMGLTSLAIILVLKFAPEVPDEPTIKKPRS